MGPHRVVVTGVGVVSAIGHDRSSFWESLRAGRHGFEEIELVDTSTLQFHLGAEVRGLDLDAPFDRNTERLLDRFARLWLLAAREAIEASGLTAEELVDSAVVTGTALGGLTTQDDLFRALYREDRKHFTPFAVPRIMASAGASHASMEFGIQGPGLTVSTACSSSNHAIGLAYWMVASGSAPTAVAGGSESPFSLGNLKLWAGTRVVSRELCRPFSRGRKGLVLGEGAGCLVLEQLDHARARGADILAEVRGFGMSSDAGHITQPSAAGAARAMRSALEDAGAMPDSVDYINAHGTGTLLNDATESEVIQTVFGAHVAELLVSSTKSMHGHALGGAGALEAVATILAIMNGVVPPTANFLGADPDCPLDVVPNTARERSIRLALSNSFAFGGLNAVIALARWDHN